MIYSLIESVNTKLRFRGGGGNLPENQAAEHDLPDGDDLGRSRFQFLLTIHDSLIGLRVCTEPKVQVQFGCYRFG